MSRDLFIAIWAMNFCNRHFMKALGACAAILGVAAYYVQNTNQSFE